MVRALLRIVLVIIQHVLNQTTEQGITLYEDQGKWVCVLLLGVGYYYDVIF